jgi:hypothetical protein
MKFEVFDVQQIQVNEFEVSKMFNEFEVSLNVQLRSRLSVNMKLPSTGRRQMFSEPLGVRRSSNGKFVVYWST